MLMTSIRIQNPPACGLLLQSNRESNRQRNDDSQQDCSNDGESFPIPISYASKLLVPYMTKLVAILVAPHTDTQSTAIRRPLSFNALTRCAQFSTSQDGHDGQLLRVLVAVLDRLNVLMGRVIAVCARSSDVDFGRRRRL